MVMFVLNERWTFNDLGDQNESTLRRFVRSNIVRGTGAAVALTTLYVLTTVFDVWYLLANAIGIGIGVVFNYTFETLITWRIHQSDTNG
jgi:putative flippase GtrA